MWATYLRGEDGVLDPRETILTYAELMTFTAQRAINDAVWLADPREYDPDDTNPAGAIDDTPEPDEPINDELALGSVGAPALPQYRYTRADVLAVHAGVRREPPGRAGGAAEG
jgi:hypothetical protein